MIENVKGDATVVAHLDYYDDDPVMPEREFFYKVLGTLQPDYLQRLIKEANRVRHKKDEEETKDELIEIREDLVAKIETEPFFSSKIRALTPSIESRGRALHLLKVKTKPKR